jgi:hypothetical protein
MGLSRSLPRTSWAPFQGIVPGAAATPISQITLPVTFGTRENFCTESIQFDVADLDTAYNPFLGRPALSKFMAIPHYAYLVFVTSLIFTVDNSFYSTVHHVCFGNSKAIKLGSSWKFKFKPLLLFLKPSKWVHVWKLQVQACNHVNLNS